MTRRLIDALLNYKRLLTYLRRRTNAEEWATHGDWARLEREGDAAIAESTAPAVDTVYVAIGRWKGVEQVWRGGVFDTPEEAEGEFEANVGFGTFVRVQAVEVR